MLYNIYIYVYVIAIMHLISGNFIIKCFIFHDNLCCGIVGMIIEWFQIGYPRLNSDSFI